MKAKSRASYPLTEVRVTFDRFASIFSCATQNLSVAGSEALAALLNWPLSGLEIATS